MPSELIIREVNLTLDDIVMIIQRGPRTVQFLCVLMPQGMMKEIPGVREMTGEGITDEDIDGIQFMGIETARIGKN